jgi:hypothetical protein
MVEPCASSASHALRLINRGDGEPERHQAAADFRCEMTPAVEG